MRAKDSIFFYTFCWVLCRDICRPLEMFDKVISSPSVLPASGLCLIIAEAAD